MGKLVWEFRRDGDYYEPNDAPPRCVEHERFLSSTSDRFKAMEEFIAFMDLNPDPETYYDLILKDDNTGRFYAEDLNGNDINEIGCSLSMCTGEHVQWEMELIDRQVYAEFAHEHGSPYLAD